MNYSQEIKSNILDTLRQNGLPFYDSYMSVFFLLYIKKIGVLVYTDPIRVKLTLSSGPQNFRALAHLGPPAQ